MKLSLVAILTLNTTIATANCEAKLSNCDAAVTAAAAYIKQLESHTEKQKEFIKLQDNQLTQMQQLLERQTPWYRKPEFLIPFTIVTTVLIGIQVDKELR